LLKRRGMMLRSALFVPFTLFFLSNCVVDDPVLDDEPALGETAENLIGPGGGDDPGCTIPATPTLAVQSTTSSSVTLVARSACENAGTAIERRLGTTGTFVRLINPPLWDTPYIDPGRTPQTQYCYRVIANIGTSTRTSNIACGTTKMAPPTAPSPVTITNITSMSMTLSFTDRSTTEDGFKVYHRAGTGYDTPTTIATTSKTGTGAVHTLVLNPTGTGNGHGTHCYLVNAYHADGQAWGTEVCAKLQTLADPPADAVQWRWIPQTGSETDLLLARKRGTLLSDSAWAYLHYYSRWWGVSLGWDDDYDWYDFEIERAPGSSLAPIVDGEQVAIKVDGGGYLQYEQRNWGINLGFSSTPKYQWRLRRLPGASGDREGYQMTGTNFAIRNDVANDYLVYGDRSNGVHLKWYSDTVETQAPPPGMQLVTDSIWLTAGNQNGWVVWQGGIGGSNDDGELQKLSLPSTTNLAGFFFLKGSAGGDKCVTADSTNGVYVRAGEAMKEGQKMVLWGDSTPSIPLTLRGCACFTSGCPLIPPPGQPYPQAIVNVEWISN
jgi:hypothetical protein